MSRNEKHDAGEQRLSETVQGHIQRLQELALGEPGTLEQALSAEVQAGLTLRFLLEDVSTYLPTELAQSVQEAVRLHQEILQRLTK